MPNIFTESKIVSYYDNNAVSKDLSFQLLEMPPEKIWNILTGLNPSKAAFIDNLSGQFLKDDTHDQYLNFAIFLLNSTTFQEVAELLMLNHFLKKALRPILKMTALFHFSPCYQKWLKGFSWPNRGLFE